MSLFRTDRPPFTVRAACLARAALAVAAAAGGALLAQPAAAQDGTAQLMQIGQRFADEALKQGQAGGMPLRMEVQIGQLDSRLRLAACAKVEPYLPAGSRLWGRTRLGLRCLQGAVAWNVFLPITVKAWGPAWVLQNGVASGRALTAGDAVQAEVDWAEDSAAVYANPADWIGLVAARPLSAGQALRQNMLRPPALFAAGAEVRVMVSGGGFAVTSSGKAMAAAGEGQTVRVRMDNGRLISGVVNPEGVVLVQ
ncbi:flagellar basal body P-ring formation chaperone FlgA [Delftia sp. PS-11]|uniref:flagellar basal body P-ring formation chaperone FlgA n=1 Tax=Delftia sp. PS-11 TaxID=2767222 RepID=UPI002454DB35|nr:flagellar basal body P-ring formation chaperone FlgA [Delftia sp. PS-11]KAJ8746257.1 flagellar basal body P-ring formation protein FlgA [Delftia sp. PS-11]